MSKFYNRTFKVGFIATLGAFVLTNFISYLLAWRQYDKLVNQFVNFAPSPTFPSWGFPFKWSGYNFDYDLHRPFADSFAVADGLVLNFLAISACGFLFGFTLRWLTGNYE